MGIDKLAEAMELPLFRRTTSGLTTQKGKNYEPTADDEVEDLYELLKQVRVSRNINCFKQFHDTDYVVGRDEHRGSFSWSDLF